MENQIFTTNVQPEVLAEHLFALNNPWRDRFLTFAAERALGPDWNGKPPTRKQVKGWLDQEGLRHVMDRMLNMWQRNAGLTNLD